MFDFDQTVIVDPKAAAREMHQAMQEAANRAGTDPETLARKFLRDARSLLKEFARVACPTRRCR